MSNPAEKQSDTMLEAWQRHVIECRVCGNAKNANEMCQMGKNFWRVPGSASMPMPSEAATPQQPYQPQPQPNYQAPRETAPPPQPSMQYQHARESDINSIAHRVLERVVARTESGSSIAIPTQKTSRSVEIATAPGVILHMPERDIEVYSTMKGMIGRFLQLAEKLGTFMMAREEAKRFAREAQVIIGDSQTAMIVKQVADHRGMPNLSAESLYNEFDEMTVMTIKLGDTIARFMAVDTETRHVMRDVRALGIDMKGEIERSSGGRLTLDGETPKVIRQMRMLAVTLQGEMERRLGT